MTPNELQDLLKTEDMVY